MIEPTESESRETLDDFVQALQRIAEEARTDPALLHDAPHSTPVRRLDEVRAAKELVLCCKPIAADLIPVPEHTQREDGA
jgi:glycine dehydrogenase subunit 2